MRIVHEPGSFTDQMERAMSEAKNSFGNDEVFVEKFIGSPKHIEVQVLGDQHGNVVHLFERECSIQRRHQKVVEEAPSALLSPEKREEIGEAAKRVAKSCQYYGAGTVEFIADENFDFYFLEMNTRLQVEHPVTELITGVDLVKEQIKIAEGQKLSFLQKDLQIHGHSVEIRVYAEDPANNFLPDTGVLKRYQRPQGAGIRVDDGYEEGLEVGIHYDPMIAKLITYGKDRQEAIARMLRAIHEYKIAGINTTLPFCKFVLQHPTFIDGTFTTKFVETYFDENALVEDIPEEALEAAFVAAFHHFEKEKKKLMPKKNLQASSKNTDNLWRNRKHLS